ncbi:MAG: DUF58 domain-containing protein [Planctomycetota bacterium]
MASIANDPPSRQGRFVSLLTTDFCPGANRFVYWLKEPVGWFVLAALMSAIVGWYVAPIGWTIAFALLAVISIGMVWPWVAVRLVQCELKSEREHTHEDQPCDLLLSVSNSSFIPIWGLAVEGFLDRDEGNTNSAEPTAALAYVKALATSTYRFTVRPQLRGHYPESETSVSCSFPFGIWTARRTLKKVTPVTVWPRVDAIAGTREFHGRRTSDHGEGSRRGRESDFTGLREYRRGDLLRSVNWVATAKAGDLVVTERSGPDSVTLQVMVDVGDRHERDAISDRIRVAASILASLHRAGTEMHVWLGGKLMRPKRGQSGFIELMNALTDVPLNGVEQSTLMAPTQGEPHVIVTSDEFGNPDVLVADPAASRRKNAVKTHFIVDRSADQRSQVFGLWKEQHHAFLVA